jgi:adenylate cyclase
VVASYGLVGMADQDEAAHWEELDPVTVRGKTKPTRIATPS